MSDEALQEAVDLANRYKAEQPLQPWSIMDCHILARAVLRLTSPRPETEPLRDCVRTKTDGRCTYPHCMCRVLVATPAEALPLEPTPEMLKAALSRAPHLCELDAIVLWDAMRSVCGPSSRS